MLFNKFDILEKNFESKKFDLREGFENFKGRKNIENVKEFLKMEFYSRTYLLKIIYLIVFFSLKDMVTETSFHASRLHFLQLMTT